MRIALIASLTVLVLSSAAAQEVDAVRLEALHANEGRPASAIVVLNEIPSADATGLFWEQGTLTFRDHTRHFRLKGLAVGDATTKSHNAVGKVFNLQRLDDFNGIYVPDPSRSTESGGPVTYLKNQHGVQTELHSTVARPVLEQPRRQVRIELQPG